MFPKLRTVVEAEGFREDCNEIQPDVRRLDELLNGLYWAVARNPFVFTRVVNNVYVAESFSWDEDQDVFIYFTVDNDDQCTLRHIVRGDAVVHEQIVVEVP